MPNIAAKPAPERRPRLWKCAPAGHPDEDHPGGGARAAYPPHHCASLHRNLLPESELYRYPDSISRFLNFPVKKPMKTLSALFSAAFVLGAALLANASTEELTPSQQIDALIENNYAAHNVTSNEPAPDAVLVRRLYLDIAGRIPSKAETEAFLAAKDPGKTGKLIGDLLASEGYVNHWFNYWADILRVNRTANNSQFVAPHYTEFIKDSLRGNKPYDQFVRDLLTTDGAAWDSGAIGYYLRDRGMPLDNMSNTVRIFLGTRLECAQCHDHPFDKWSQLDYYEMAAFSYDMQSNYRSPVMLTLRDALSGRERSRDMSRERREGMEAMRGAVQEMMRPLRYTEIHRDDQTLRLPDDYQYDNAEPREPVEPKTMFGDEAAPDLDAYAAWMTSKSNPRFTTVVANRLWKQAFGIGLIEPVDEITDQTKATNPELMAYLEERMKALNYDLKAFLGMIFNTRTYQRQATREEIVAGEPYHYPGPLLRRMSAEQIWDSFVTLINPEPDARPEQAIAAAQAQLEMTHKIHDSIEALESAELLDGLKSVAKSAAEGVARTRELTALIAEARKEKDEEKMRELSREASRYRGDVRAQVREHIYEPGWEKLVASGAAAETFGEEAAAKPIASRSGDRAAMDMSSERGEGAGMSREDRRQQLEKYMKLAREAGITDRNEFRKFVESREKMSGQVYRAANLPSPAPNGHFLREFGQSDRDVIENANDEASLPQALQLLNGPYAEAMVGKFGVLAREIERTETPDDRLDVIYLSLYSRYPTQDERNYMAPMIAELGNEAYKDLVVAILNTQQFLFIQ